MGTRQREQHKEMRREAAWRKDAEKYRDYYDWEERDDCWQCGGEGYLIAGEDIDLDDPVNNCDWSMGVDAGEVGLCPCCRGTGNAADCMYG